MTDSIIIVSLMWLETERVIIREFAEGDFESFAKLYGDPEIMKFSPKVFTQEESREFLQEVFDDYQTLGFSRWAVILKETQKMIGIAGLKVFEIDQEKKVELAYRFFREFRGKGLAFEAAQAIRDYAFSILKLKEIISLIDPDNLPSIRLAQKLGMQPLKRTKFLHLDVIVYGLFNP